MHANTPELVKPIIINLLKELIRIEMEKVPDCWSRDITGQQRIAGCMSMTNVLLDIACKGIYPEIDPVRGILTEFAVAKEKDQELTVDRFFSARELTKSPVFTVNIAKYTESHQVTYHVILHNESIVATELEEGKINCFQSTNLNHANIEGKAWADFLKVPFTPLMEET